MIARVSLSCWDGGWKRISEEDYRTLASLTGLPEEKPSSDTDYTLRLEKLLIDTDLIADILLTYKFEVDIEPVTSAGMLVKLRDKISGMEGRVSDLEMVKNGSMVQVHVPNLGLMMIDEVMVCEDYCTDALQKDLNDGWRILAVCPPNAQRRPDYVMGRTRSR